MYPVLGWKVVKRQHLVAILSKTIDRLGILRVVFLDEVVKRLPRRFLCLSLPNLVEAGFGSGLDAFGQLVEHIGRFVHPTSLVARGREDLL